MDSAKTVCVIGLGHIGLPTAALLASRGYDVRGVDVAGDVVAMVNSGSPPFAEPGLEALLRKARRSEKLRAATTPAPADIFIIAVPTPCKEAHQPDISVVVSAVTSIVPFVERGNSVILESTSPIDTTQRVVELLRSAGSDVDHEYFAYCPERSIPGRTMIELAENDRIVGGTTCKGASHIAAFYRSFVTGRVLETDARTAELVKLAENSYRDVQIAFANELSIVCDSQGIDVWEVVSLANRHPRVNILDPGPGVGGHCVAIDPWFLVDSAPGEAVLIRTARERNLFKTEWVISKIEDRMVALERQLRRPVRVACMGLTYKADTDDLRESPALQVTAALTALGYDVVGVEPHRASVPGVVLKEQEEALRDCDLAVYLVPHAAFRVGQPPLEKVIDFCGVTRS